MQPAFVILTLSFVLQTLATAARFGMGIFLVPIAADLGVRYGEVSFVIAVFALTFGLFTPFVGTLTDRYGARSLLVAGLAVMGASYFLTASVSHVIVLFLTLGLLSGIGFAALTPVVHAALISRWFDKDKGWALGVSNSGMGVAQVLFIPLIVFATSQFGWRASMTVSAVVLFVLIPAVLLWVKSSPNERHLTTTSTPDELVGGRTPSAGTESTAPASTPRAGMSSGTSQSSCAAQDAGTSQDVGSSPSGTTVSAETTLPSGPLVLRRHLSFWQMALSFFGCGFTMMMLIAHLPGMITLHMGSESWVALIMGLLGLANIIGTLLLSGLSDRIGRKTILGGAYVIRSLTLLAVALHPNLLTLLLFALLFGASWVITGPMTSALAGDFFGSTRVGSVFGWCFFTHQIGGFIGTSLGGFFVDATGSYTIPLMAAAGVSALSATLAFSIREKRTLTPAPPTPATAAQG